MKSAPGLAHRLAYVVLAVASAAYVTLTLLAPVAHTARTYSLSPRAIHSIELSIALPFVVIWFIALWASLRFRRYAVSIQSGPDGRALKLIANGLITLVAGLVTTAALQSLNSRMIAWGHAKVWALIINYGGLFLALLAMVLILRGAWQLAGLVRFRGLGRWRVGAPVVLLIIGVGYALLLVHDPYRSFTPDATRFSSYYLSNRLLILTIVLPYLATWYCGLLAVACLHVYQTYATGIIYRQALRRVSAGLLTIIATSILIQILNAMGASLAHLGLKDLFVLVYVLVLVYVAGHIMVAIGARSLAKIEAAGAS